jgi:hypothetical protein
LTANASPAPVVVDGKDIPAVYLGWLQTSRGPDRIAVFNSAHVCDNFPATLGVSGENPCHKPFQVRVPRSSTANPADFVGDLSLGGCGSSQLYIQRGGVRFRACRRYDHTPDRSFCPTHREIFTFECPLW